MLTSLLGIRLVLWLGRSVPRPAPTALLDSLVSAQVSNDAGGIDGFSVTFNVSKDGDDYSALAEGALDPETRIWLGVAMGVTPEPLIDGIITNVSFTPSPEPGRSTITVTGLDVTVALQLEQKLRPHDNQSDSTIFSKIILEYGQYGLVPMPQTTSEQPNQTERTPRQRDTDFDFITRLAQRNGFVFFIEPLTFGSSKAFFGEQPRSGARLPALTINMGGDSNVTALSFNADALSAVSAQARVINRQGRTSVLIPATPVVRTPPLAAQPAPVLRTVTLDDTAHMQPGQAITAAFAHAMGQPDANNCHGTIDGVRYGTVLRARRIVGLRGAGRQHNGDWFVKRVEHQIQRGSYTQNFQLSREGRGALSPFVTT